MKKLRQEINGILLFDKPSGCSSNRALQRVKFLFNAKKAGHTGSLDPLATGLLPICFGKATKWSQKLLDTDKCYIVTAKLGAKTDTGDSDGKIIESVETVPDYSQDEIKQAILAFQGEIEQVPPMYSALKHNGKRLYELARKGIEVERPARKIKVYEFVLLNKHPHSELECRIHCSKGTYVRSLIEDLGDKLGCGAHVTSLRRIAAGPYHAEDSLDMNQLEKIFEEQGQQALMKTLIPISQLPSLDIGT